MNKDTEQNILKTAIELFSDRGKDGVSTAEIAETAGVNKALIFYYFGSKDGLYVESFKTIIRQYLTDISAVISSTEPGVNTLEVFIREHIRMLRKNQQFARMFLREIIPAGDEISPALQDCSDILGNLRSILYDAVIAARAKGEIRDVDPIQTIVSIISLNVFYFIGKPLVRLINPQIDSVEFEQKRVEYVLDLLFNGLRATPENSNES